jgi:CO/xanthine dehydrogenase FAD-binding subunit
MKPCAFEYLSPQTVEEAIDLLDRYGDEAKIIAGGQSLVPMMNFRLARPEILIDINGIKELEFIKTEGDELVIGALTRERDIEQSPAVVEKWPLLSKAISFNSISLRLYIKLRNPHLGRIVDFGYEPII